MPPADTDTAAVAAFPITSRRTGFLGLNRNQVIRGFFGGNAFVSVVVLGLITIFLFREGREFFGQNRRNLEIYRVAGLEFVDIMKRQDEAFVALNRALFDIRMLAARQTRSGQPLATAAELEAFDAYASEFGDAAGPLRDLVSELSDTAATIKTKYVVNEDRLVERHRLLAEGKQAEAAAVQIETIDTAAELQPLLASRTLHAEISAAFAKSLTELSGRLPAMGAAELRNRLKRFAELTRDYVSGFPKIEKELVAWRHDRPVPFLSAITAFAFGREWLTASFWQDWYGVLPLVVGSFLISLIALALAVPLGVAGAIYINQIARPAEQRVIKPCIEFISAFPSVVLGFFGIAVLGEALRKLSHVPWLEWLPGFPIAERLNALTAGCLLGLIAVPTIFTLAEDALQNVPKAFKEASFALGATRLQTILRIILPAGLSGIISAVLLGLGRVIGETMVVLLCAGNRIAIPDFSAGIGVITQPVHTMTGIIAQEMGEVVQGSIHYRALFAVGILLFCLSLLINFVAQKILSRYRLATT